METLKKLQLFAEDGQQTANESAEPNTDSPKGEQQTEKQAEPKAELKYSEEDIDRIINQKFAKWKKAEETRINEAEKLAKMNAQQKAEYESEKLKEELNILRAEKVKAELTAQARRMLSESDITINDELLNIIVSGDAETTKNSVENFSKLYKEALQQGIANALKGNAPKSGTKSGAISKEEILAVKDKNERQRLINENITLFTGGTK